MLTSRATVDPVWYQHRAEYRPQASEFCPGHGKANDALYNIYELMRIDGSLSIQLIFLAFLAWRENQAHQ